MATASALAARPLQRPRCRLLWLLALLLLPLPRLLLSLLRPALRLLPPLLLPLPFPPQG